MYFGIVALSFLFFFDGLTQAYRSIIWIFQWRRSQQWRSTHGEIIQSDLQYVQVPAGGRKSRNFDGSVRLVTAYAPIILYEYRVNGESFQSRQIFIGQQFPSSLRFSNELVEKYSVGKKVTVFYDPDKPEVATLERHRVKELLLQLAGAVLYLFFGFAILSQAFHE